MMLLLKKAIKPLHRPKALVEIAQLWQAGEKRGLAADFSVATHTSIAGNALRRDSQSNIHECMTNRWKLPGATWGNKALIAPGPPMHRVLLINEILHNIAEQSTRRDSLCKRTKQSQGDRGSKVVFKLRRIFTPPDWMVLVDHAKHVVTLQFLHRRHEDIDIDFFRSMAYPPIAGALFPKLKQATWNDGRLAAFPFLRILLSPSITSLSITGNIELDMQNSAILASLGSICPALKRLYFFPHKALSSRAPISALSQAVTLWSQLRELDCGPLNEEAIRHLASLSSLRSLEFYLSGSIAAALAKSPLHDDSFDGLNYLAIDDSRGFEATAKLLKTVRLQSATLSFHSAPFDVGITSLCQALVKNCNKDTLKDLTIKEGRGGRDESLEYQISYQTLRPLFCYRHLHSLTIDTSRSTTLDDVALLNIGKAWPQLSFLHINPQSGWIIPSNVTLKGLASLLGLCPKLENLALAIKTDNNDDGDDDDRASNYITSRLDTLNVLDSELATDDVLEVASFMSDVVPNLGCLIAWDGMLIDEEDADDYRHRWDQAFEAMGAFVRARKMERKRWTGRTSPTVGELVVSDDEEGSQGDSLAGSLADTSSSGDHD
ncbi:hypothetical protein CONPUDRAFT_145378 [Coniophora puteana RWD-64-598 SS2]|uniref:RNI-like protein n=1 Tax=Coniophora puteana (strain RWD-64-598) TaxID=741705 RepID=A0A5M3MKF8_CONPW|nr:uncharacterized protein CONPUDRAFT_145378 [Coniophora puteana RWD-64-598 SS2]EIW79304.1 hypothetical protein CONPUDRAFT_145378 [Coniophora puteana RWD-64-598 SS2]